MSVVGHVRSEGQYKCVKWQVSKKVCMVKGCKVWWLLFGSCYLFSFFFFTGMIAIYVWISHIISVAKSWGGGGGVRS